MRSLIALPLLLTVLPALASASEAPPAAPPVAVFSPAECQVFQRELAFADTVARHDGAGFAEKIDAQAVFGAGRPAPRRGREAIVEAWSGLVSGKDGKLEWYPDRTTVGGEPDVAWSTGPSLFEDTSPGAQTRYRLGRFQSVWHRGADGAWRVLFDEGTPPRPATEAEAAAFRAARPHQCPDA